MEHDAACYITMLREEKFSEEEIEKKLSNHRMADGSKLSKAHIQRLGKLRLRYDEDSQLSTYFASFLVWKVQLTKSFARRGTVCFF